MRDSTKHVVGALVAVLFLCLSFALTLSVWNECRGAEHSVLYCMALLGGK